MIEAMYYVKPIQECHQILVTNGSQSNTAMMTTDFDNAISKARELAKRESYSVLIRIK